jgi:putative ABC transport system permease protein
MIMSFLKMAWRNLNRNKFNTTISIAGLTLGITCFLIIHTKLNYETGFDQFHSHVNKIYRLVRLTKDSKNLGYGLEYRTGVFFALPDAIKKQIPELDAVTQVLYNGGGLVRIKKTKDSVQQKIFKENKGIALLEPEFFEVFDYKNTDFQWIIGNPQESLSQPYSIVLTKTLSDKYFGDENPIGHFIEIMGFELQVTGLTSDFPPNTDFPFQLLISLSTLQTAHKEMFTNWSNLSDNFQCYIKINNKTDDLEIEKKIKEIHAAHTTPEMAENRLFKLQPLSMIHTDKHFGNYNNRVISQSTILSLMSIGILLLMMACINHSNITVAQLSSRVKAAGICKVFGSNRRALIMQFFCETFILTIVSLVFSILFLDIILVNLSDLIGVPQENLHLIYFKTIWLLPALIVAVSIMAGIYPSILITKTNPVEMIRNKGFKTGKGSLWFNRLTVIFQFIIAQILIVCVLVIFQQLSFIESKDLGYDRENIITVNIPDNNPMILERFKQSLLQNSDISNVSYASINPGRSRNWTDASRMVKYSILKTITEAKSVDSAYIHTYGIQLISGRNFSNHESGFPVIVNQKLIEDLQFEDERQAIGKSLFFYNQTATIIGVVRDFHSTPIYQMIRPCVLHYHPGQFNMAGIRYNLSSDKKRFHSQIEELIRKIKKQWQALFPDQIYEYEFFDETIASYYQEEKKVASLINIFTGIMIFICCLGIIGLIFYTTNRKTKELAVRKVVGAGELNIFILLVKNFMKWALIANIFAWPVAWYAMNKWLQNYAYRIHLSIWPFLLAGSAALVIALLTVSWRAIRVATADPVEALKYE